MKKTIAAIFLVLIPGVIMAQEDLPGTTYTPVEMTFKAESLLTQYWAMPTLVNPAASGDTDYVRIRGGARLELLGSDESPKYFMGTADAPFKFLGKRIGAGIVAYGQNYGLFRNYLLGIQGSYKLNALKGQWSLGVQIGYYHSTFKGSDMKLTLGGNEGNGEDEDPDMPESYYPTHDVQGGVFDLGIGLKYEHKNFNVGLSMLHLTNPEMKLSRGGDSSDLQYIKSRRPATLYFEGGGNIGINNTLFTLHPSMVLASDFKDFQGLIEMRATYNRKFTFGIDYRWNEAAGLFAGLILKDFYVGYSWEYNYRERPRGSTGNHELVLGYQFKMDMGGNQKYSRRSIRLM